MDYLLKQWRIGFLAIGISLIAATYIIFQIDLNILSQSLQAARFIFVVPCLLLLFMGLVARGMRWQHLLSQGLPFARAFHIMNVAYLVNSLLPLRMGELARAYLGTRAEPPVPVLQSFSAIIVERLLDLLAVVILIGIGLASSPVPEELQYAGVLFGSAGFTGFVGLVWLSRSRQLALRVLCAITDRIEILRQGHLERWFEQFLDGLLPLARLDHLMTAMGWTVLSWGLSVAAGYVLMHVFYDQASLSATCLYIAAAAFAIAVPAVPGSLGTYELSIVLALNAVGYGEPATTAAAFAVTVHLVNLVVHSAMGVLGFVQEGISLQQLQQGVRDVTEARNT